MNQKIIRGCSGAFSASMLIVLGCAPLATGSEGTVAMETETDTEAQARSELAMAETSAPKQATAAQETTPYAGEAQAPGSGPASLAVVPGLTILNGEKYASDSQPDWTLDSGSGTRTVTRFINFPTDAFSSPPAVSVSLSEFNTKAVDMFRSYINITAEDVTISGFNLKFTTGSTAVVYSATATWIAYGPNSLQAAGVVAPVRR